MEEQTMCTVISNFMSLAECGLEGVELKVLTGIRKIIL